MTFVPKKQPNTGGDYEDRNFPTPKPGSRKARVSLIIDLGEQNRKDFENPDGTTKPQKPCQQVAVFADLVADVVDYGGTVGKQQYRMLLNKTFSGVTEGVNFQAVPPKDAEGNIIAGKPWTLHPANVLTKLAKATEQLDVIESLDISKLLNLPFMADIEVKETPARNDKKDKDGNPIIYKNVNFKGAAKVPMVEDEDGNEAPMKVAALKEPARCITFDTATVDDIQYIRKNLIKIIKLANDYSGSNMQKAIEAFEAKTGNVNTSNEAEDESEEAPTKVEKPKAVPKKPLKPVAPVIEDMDDVPF